MGGEAAITWRGYLLAMLQQDMEELDLDPKAREVFKHAIRELSAEDASPIPVLTSDLPPHLEFLAGYPAELRERTLQRLKADGILP